MKANLVELRRSPRRILEAVKKRETVVLSRRGKPIAKITPITDTTVEKTLTHAAYGMWQKRKGFSVEAEIKNLRKGRFDDL